MPYRLQPLILFQRPPASSTHSDFDFKTLIPLLHPRIPILRNDLLRRRLP